VVAVPLCGEKPRFGDYQMAEITAGAVKSLREKTGLPMMDCKRALEEAQGDQEKAIEGLRKAGAKTMEKRAGRATISGRIAVHVDRETAVAAMVDLRCESAPVANNDEFNQLTNDLARQLASGPGAASADQLLLQPSPSRGGQTLRQQFDDLNNRIREAFKIERIVKIDGVCGGYAHHNGAVGVLLQVEGGSPELARDICMHIAALRPLVINKEELDPAVIAKEREILGEAARNEGKPEKIIEKMVEGRLKDFYAQSCLAEQTIANEMKYGKKTVGQVAKEAGMKIIRFVHWELPKE
jgi:elongation factor Ts